MSRDKGSRFEQIALKHLVANNLQLIEQNFHCRLGEIDLVLRDGESLVFVEVRYRKSNRFASAAHSVNKQKQAKIARTAAMYLARHPALSRCTVRFDVVAFDSADSDHGALQWIRDAFRV
ncbi:MAG: YraN family protein [Proteobacteria bacterium]|nr:YraN family protein [Pseudomonadota bacterium]MDA0992822.1 YraN family protein [Pseudomonadota bacterium]